MCKRMKRIYWIIMLTACLFMVTGCGKEAEAEPQTIISFTELDAEGVADWNLDDEQADVQADEQAGNTDNKEVAEEESAEAVADNDSAQLLNLDMMQSSDTKEGVWFCMDDSVLENALYAEFLQNEAMAIDNVEGMYIPYTFIHDFYGQEFTLNEMYETYERETEEHGGIKGVQIFGRDFDADGKDELVVLIEVTRDAGVMHIFKEKSGKLYAWEELAVSGGEYEVKLYEGGMISRVTEDTESYFAYNAKGVLEPVLFYQDNRTERQATLVLYQNAKESKRLEYEYTYLERIHYEELTPENQVIRREVNEIRNAFYEELSEAELFMTLCGYYKVNEVAAKVTWDQLLSGKAMIAAPDRSVHYVSYHVDNNVKDNELFMQFINNQAVVHESLEEQGDETQEAALPADDQEVYTEGETDILFDGKMYIKDIYGEYAREYPALASDEVWYAFDAVTFTVRDMDGDGKEELLMLVTKEDREGNLHVFHEEKGQLYLWETLEGVRSNEVNTSTYFFEDGMIGIVEENAQRYVRYNAAGEIEDVLTVESGLRPNGEFEADGIYFIYHRATFYEAGNVKRILYYEDKYQTDSGEFMSTTDVMVKKDYEDAVLVFEEELGDGTYLAGVDEKTRSEVRNMAELIGGYRLDWLDSDDVRRKFLDGEIPAYLPSAEGDVINSEEYFYIDENFPGINSETAPWWNVGNNLANYEDLDGDNELEVMVYGYYGGTYFDVRDGVCYVLVTGTDSAHQLSWARCNTKEWIVVSDATVAGREYYHFYKYNQNGRVVDEFTLEQLYLDTPAEPDGPGTIYKYNGEEVSREEYERVIGSYTMYSTSKW